MCKTIEDNYRLRILSVVLDDGRTEYQVSNGAELYRTYSYEFYTLHEAEMCLNELALEGEYTGKEGTFRGFGL